nr:hypothetical protein GCM10020063_004570 [Dactylosporangium thailandense]
MSRPGVRAGRCADGKVLDKLPPPAMRWRPRRRRPSVRGEPLVARVSFAPDGPATPAEAHRRCPPAGLASGTSRK